ncbi:TOPRIM nucleotidyl transferase/hydrolase domain-containing protein, partial [[Clostridium] scindens]
IDELQKRVQDKNEEKKLPEKVIICEGKTDEIILQALARKLNQKVTIIVADGKYKVPVIFDTVTVRNIKSNILIVIDSDGNEKETKKMIVEKIGADNYELAIINNSIEDWFMPEVADFSKLKLMQSIDAIIEEIDLAELCNNHESFAKVVEFLQK